MRASRSIGSTTAPHFVILSTSFVHAALLRRCWRMMRASWHSRQAVVAFACIGPAGRSAVTPAAAGFCAWAENGEANTRTSSAMATEALAGNNGALHSGSHPIRGCEAPVGMTILLRSSDAACGRASSKLCRALGNMDLHLIYGVVEVAARIPDCRGGLGASLAVGGARQEGVVAGLSRFPIVGPKAPGIVSLIVAELCRNPGGAAIDRNLDLFYIGFPGPGCAVHADIASS